MSIFTPRNLKAADKANAAGRHFPLHGYILGLLFFVLVSCSDAHHTIEPSSFTLSAQRWHEAETLFRADKQWLGGDGAYSTVLQKGKVLWLFGDSFIGNGKTRERKDAVVVRNSIAIQKGSNPAKASIEFFWEGNDGKPDAFFKANPPCWYWPGSGVMIGSSLLVFLMEIEPEKGGLGFAVKGWKAVLIGNPFDTPVLWKKDLLRIPEQKYGVIIGSACSFAMGDYLYAFGARASGHGAYVVRWRFIEVAEGNLMHPQWWTGRDGWIVQDELISKPEPVFPDAQMEFSVHFEPELGGFLEVQTDSFTNHCLVYRWSKTLTGPWSEKKRIFCPQAVQGVLVYAGKAHQGLDGADLICTYAINSLDTGRLLGSNGLYYPVCIKAEFRKASEITLIKKGGSAESQN